MDPILNKDWSKEIPEPNNHIEVFHKEYYTHERLGGNKAKNKEEWESLLPHWKVLVAESRDIIIMENKNEIKSYSQKLQLLEIKLQSLIETNDDMKKEIKELTYDLKEKIEEINELTEKQSSKSKFNTQNILAIAASVIIIALIW